MANKVVHEIENKRVVSLDKFVYGLGIRGVGETTSRQLAVRYGALEKLASATQEELEAIPEVGPVTALNIVRYFQSEHNKEMLEKMNVIGLGVTSMTKANTDIFKNRSFVITGSFESFDRQKLKSVIEDNGGKVLNKITKPSQYLILGKNAGTKHAEALRIGATVMSEQQFVDCLEKGRLG